jgi:hypothetical protein
VPAADTALRLAVRGVGQVRISHVSLTDGVTVLALRQPPPAAGRLLGRPAPQQGLPALDWDRNQAVLKLEFRPVRP